MQIKIYNVSFTYKAGSQFPYLGIVKEGERERRRVERMRRYLINDSDYRKRVSLF